MQLPRAALGVSLAALLFVGAPLLAQPAPDAPETPPAEAAAADEPTEAAPDGPEATDGGEEPGDATPPGDGMPAGDAAPDAPKPIMDGSTYTVRLRDLQQRIDQLKEQIRRSHTRLSLLSDTILSTGSSGSRSTIQFENKLSSQFKLTRALIVFDGAVQYNKNDRSGALADQELIPVFSGSIPPGDHTIQVLINLRGNGYGVFSYLRGYRFEVRSSHSFTAVEGKTTQTRIVAYEKGGVTTPLEERPAIRYVDKVVSGLVDNSGQPASD